MTTPPPGATAPPDLATLERVERSAFRAFFEAAPPAVAARFGLRVEERDGCLLLAARELPLFKWNRAVGLGTAGPAAEAQLDAALAWLRRHADPGFAVQVAPGTWSRELGDWLGGRGFRPDGNGWAKLRRDASPASPAPPAGGLEVREVGRGEAATFGAVCSAAFAYPAGLDAWIAGMIGSPNVRAYIAYDGGTPAGTGLMYVEGGWAWLGFGGVLPDRRGRGAQRALHARRLADGVAMGLHGFTTETTNPIRADDEDGGSFRNAHRAGFALAYARPNYRPPGMGQPAVRTSGPR